MTRASRGSDTPTASSLVQRGWVVVSTHRAPLQAGGPYPWGTAHVKRIGSTRTACGELAQGWRAFWHLDFRRDVDRPCRDCATELRVALLGQLPASGTLRAAGT